MKCPNCGTELPGNVKFCFECGEKQGPSRQPIFSSEEIAEIQQKSQPDEYLSRLKRTIQEGLQIERRDVAVMFVDISGFSAMLSKLSPDDLRSVMRVVYSVMSEVITRNDGYVDKFIGDEVMAVFGAPIALERPCQRAIAAADEMAMALEGVSQRFKHLLPTHLAVHTGIAFGNVQAGRLGESAELQYTFLGETVNLAKRLTDAATPGAVLVEKQTQLRAKEEFEFESLGELRLAGVETPVTVFRVVGPRSAALKWPGLSRLGAPMIGRNGELQLLKESFRRVADNYPNPQPCEAGKGKYRQASQIFGITGDAGIGKSRLALELKAYLQQQLGPDGFRWLVGRSWSIGRTPLYLPLKMQISSGLWLEVAASREAIENGLLSLRENSVDNATFLPYLSRLFGVECQDSPIDELDPKSAKKNMWIAMRRLFTYWSLEKPLVLVFEDMQWADGGTSDFLSYLADFAQDFPVMVLLLYRAGYKPTVGKGEDATFTELRLGRLSSESERELLEFYIHTGEKEQALLRRLRRYSEGNPLFVEEFLLMLLEQGKLAADDGKMRLVGEIGEIALPTHLAGVVGARFDRLTQRDKRVAYYAAVIGGAFPYALLSYVHDALHGVADVHDALDSLLAREIILQKRVEPELEYAFKHAITRQILVSRLIRSLKCELCRLIAAKIEERYEGQLSQFHGMLSEHWETAGDVAKAARYAALWGIYNRKQQQNFDAQAAFERYDRVSEGLDSSPLSVQEQKDLIVSRVAVLQELGRWDAAIELCKSLAALADGEWQGIALCEEARLRELKGDWQQSLSLAQKALERARQTGDKRTEAASIRRIGVAHDQSGQWDLAIRCFEQSLDIHRELNFRPGIAACLIDIGIVRSNLGDYDEAILRFEEASDIYRELGDRRNVALALQATGAVCYQRGHLDEALEHYEEAMLTCRELGSRRGLAALLLNTSLAHSDRGDFDMALRSLDEALSIFRELGDQTGIGSALNNIASVCADMGQWAKAKEASLEAESVNRAIGSRAFLSDSLAVLCRAEAAVGRWEAALSSGDEARTIADEVKNLEQIVISRLSLSEAHLCMQRWHVEGLPGPKPPVSLDEAADKAADYAEQAKEIAETNGMKGYVTRADGLLAEIKRC
ncbi:MAG: tetratricopeptide repeat protein [Candidatus Coatesbacteria bacterium]|nr:tetratricopeptide repeat protein [Candidatus Coatesbacteria bacterium]